MTTLNLAATFPYTQWQDKRSVTADDDMDGQDYIDSLLKFPTQTDNPKRPRVQWQDKGRPYDNQLASGSLKQIRRTEFVQAYDGKKKKFRKCNIGIPTGAINGIFVLDLDFYHLLAISHNVSISVCRSISPTLLRFVRRVFAPLIFSVATFRVSGAGDTAVVTTSVMHAAGVHSGSLRKLMLIVIISHTRPNRPSPASLLHSLAPASIPLVLIVAGRVRHLGHLSPESRRCLPFFRCLSHVHLDSGSSPHLLLPPRHSCRRIRRRLIHSPRRCDRYQCATLCPPPTRSCLCHRRCRCHC